MKLLYYAPASYGGIADYAHEQANALVELGIEVTLLCPPGYPIGKGEKYQIVQILQEIAHPNPGAHRWVKALHFIKTVLANFSRLADYIERQQFQSVLLGSYLEYFAPLWSGRLRQLASSGVVFGAVVHDPVRNFVVGPLWWHRWSIACGYSFLREAFVHYPIQLDTVQPMPHLRTTVIPHGTFQFPVAGRSRAATRRRLQLPADARVMLAFGHIRDNKNLDLIIQAMAQFPDVYLLVAGKEQSSGQKPVAFYQTLATTWQVAARCRWQVEFIPESEVANLFEASDLVLLTYSQTFHSASGVLNTAVSYRKPCLASGGEGALGAVVQHYQLGIWVEPDEVSALARGIQTWLEDALTPQWERYLAEQSWMQNAKQVAYCLGECPDPLTR
ncbi:MAG: glycosyltransferase family 4 protein [Kovacikia sp.]